MTRSEVRTFINAGVSLLSPATQFNAGRISEFNSEPNKEFPYVWAETIEANTSIPIEGQAPIDDWNIVLHIAKLDKPDSAPAAYEALIDTCDGIAQQLVKNYNDIVSGFNLVKLSGITRRPFVKKGSDPYTGVILTLNLNAPDTTNLC